MPNGDHKAELQPASRTSRDHGTGAETMIQHSNAPHREFEAVDPDTSEFPYTGSKRTVTGGVARRSLAEIDENHDVPGATCLGGRAHVCAVPCHRESDGCSGTHMEIGLLPNISVEI